MLAGDFCNMFDSSAMLVGTYEDIVADKSSDFSHRGSNSIVLSAETRGDRLGSNQADIVAGSHFSKHQEDTVDDHEAGDIVGLLEVPVAPTHDESHTTLSDDKGK